MSDTIHPLRLVAMDRFMTFVRDSMPIFLARQVWINEMQQRLLSVLVVLEDCLSLYERTGDRDSVKNASELCTLLTTLITPGLPFLSEQRQLEYREILALFQSTLDPV